MTSSEIFIEFNIRDGAHNAYLNNHPIFLKSYLLPPGTVSELQLLKLSEEQMNKLTEKVKNLVLNTTEGSQYELEKLFLPNDKRQRKHWGPPPGTIRVFSSEHISYYTGKSWRKVTLS